MTITKISLHCILKNIKQETKNCKESIDSKSLRLNGYFLGNIKMLNANYC